MSALVCPGLRPGRAGAGVLTLLASVLPAIGADFAPDPSVLGRPLAIAADGRVPVPLLQAAAPPAAPTTNDTLRCRGPELERRERTSSRPSARAGGDP